MKRVFFLSIITGMAVSVVCAQDGLKTKSISVFKNGKSFVVKEGVVPVTGKAYTMQRLPAALFGTFWFAGTQSDITQVSSKQEIVDETIERKAGSFQELLYANKGKPITLATIDDKSYTGIVEDFDLPEEINSNLQLKETELTEQYGSSYEAGFRLFTPADPVLLLKMNNKWISINPANIKTIEFSEKPEKTVQSKVKVKKPVIKVHFVQDGQQNLAVMYLQNGISWSPVYMLELVSETEARLKLQAEVINDVEDIKNTDINFVVGVPNFKYANNAATLTSFTKEILRNISNASNYFSNNIMASQVMDYTKNGEYSRSEVSNTVEDVNAEASEDYYFYNIKNVDLDKGARAHYPLLNSLVKIKHIYECSLPFASQDIISQGNEYSFDTKYSNVYHSIEIRNDTKSPFTTGPVMIVQGDAKKPLAQDIIKYTGKGLSSTIQLTQSPDIRVEEKEKIIATKNDAKKKNGYTYNQVTVQSEVTIINSKNSEVELAISKQVAGKAEAASIKYDSRPVINGGDVNPLDNLKFNTNVKAGQSFKFTYTYTVYVRN